VQLKRFPIREKLLISFTGLFIIVLLITLMIISLVFYREREVDLERELENVTHITLEIVLRQIRLIAKNQLREDARTALSVIDFLYQQGKVNGLSDEEIHQQAIDYLSQIRIGETGYLYVLDSFGDLQFHPLGELQGSSVIDHNFIRTQVKEKEGYLEYRWKNPEELHPYDKALYMTYFEPFDWIISASAYQEDFLSLVKLEDVKDSLNNIPVADGGYPFLLDEMGNVLIHPQLEGENIYHLPIDSVDTTFLHDIPKLLNGKSFYQWQDPETGRIISKALIYRHIPEMGWIIGSTVPMAGYTGVLNKFYLLMLLIFVVSLAVFVTVSRKMAVMLIAPLTNIIDFIRTRGYSELDERLVVSGNDEYALLSKGINDFFDIIEEETNNRLIAEEENRILAQFTNGNPYPVMRVDGKGNILYVNKASIQLMRHWGIAFHTRLPADLVARIADLGKEFADIEYEYKNCTYNIVLSYFETEKAYYLLITDITERKENEYLLLMSESVFSHTMEGIMITDPDGTIVRINPAFTQISGYSEEEVCGRNPRFLNSHHQPGDFFREMWGSLEKAGTWSGEVWNRRKSGEAFPEWLTINSINDEKGELIHYVGIFKDISDIKESEEKLRYQVSHDALTGLPNRILFEDRLNRAIARAKRGNLSLVVLFLDMDNFKNINDSLGHQAGDDFLKIIAERLVQSCRGEDTVARLGGDEFVILIPELTEQHNIIEITNRLQETVGEPLLFNTHELHPMVSIGVTVYPEDGTSPQMLMKNADLAMYKAKEMGKGTYSLFNQEMNRQVRKRMDLENLLKKSLRRNEMYMVYQPKVSPQTGKITGMEALVRWQNKVMGLISPVDFIPLAEESGFILTLGDWVLEKSLSDLQDILSVTGDRYEMAVNLSPRQFRDKKLIERIKAVMGKIGTDPSLVNFEITEHAAMEKSEESLAIMKQLRQLGVRLSIDDFGTGYSSYSYMTQFEMNCLKIDKSFIDEVPDHRNPSAIMKNIIDLGHTLNMEVVAEGVETEAQVKFLAESGCDIIQGYYYYKPMSKEDLINVLTNNQS
jgi:diguanylate cyclase (GGDEF)-like protein/PAS domain S-box-containing protein